MLQRKNRSWTTSNDETDSQKQSLLHRFFHHHHHISPHISTLYSACQNNDLVQVEDCLKNMKPIEIDHQYAPSNETVLHMATRNQSKEMIKTLLSYGIQRSLRNIHGQQAYHLAQNKEIEDLFQRPKSSRFTFLHKTNSVSNLSEYKNKCKSCSLINDKTFYEWELINENASQIALRFRRELKPLIFMNENDFKQKLYSIHKGYIKTRLQHISTADHERISSYFKRALYEHKPYYIITAYTICQSFTELLNQDLARNVIHDIKNGCSKFSCDCLYSTEDGTKSITNIFFYHPKFRELSYKGEVYRGIVIEKLVFNIIKLGHVL
ncbi:hypothetical protein I4U23_015414 [Adineta vaga]|nr:hypothetical protein I4U23_015414 [Adineta vaga]